MTVEAVTVEVHTEPEQEPEVSAPVIVVIPETSSSADLSELEALRVYKGEREEADRVEESERLARVEEVAELALEIALEEVEEATDDAEPTDLPEPDTGEAVQPDEKPNREHAFYRGWK